MIRACPTSGLMKIGPDFLFTTMPVGGSASGGYPCLLPQAMQMGSFTAQFAVKKGKIHRKRLLNSRIFPQKIFIDDPKPIICI